jgi:hypothetical protein
MSDQAPASQLALEGLRTFRQDLLRRIDFLIAGRVQVRVRHGEEWVDATEQVIANLFRQLGETGSLIHALAAPGHDPSHPGESRDP